MSFRSDFNALTSTQRNTLLSALNTLWNNWRTTGEYQRSYTTIGTQLWMIEIQADEDGQRSPALSIKRIG